MVFEVKGQVGAGHPVVPKEVKDPNAFIPDAFACIERTQMKSHHGSPLEGRVDSLSKDALAGRIHLSEKDQSVLTPEKVDSDPKKKLPEPDQTELLIGMEDYLTDEEYQKRLQDAGLGDYMTDAEIQERLARASKPDDIEDQTMNILIHLQTLADGKSRKDIEAATRHKFKDVDLDDLVQKAEDYDNLHESRFNPFRQETNFDDQDYMGRPAHTFKAVKKVISALASILFGVELLTPEFKDTRSFAEIEKSLEEDRDEWNNRLVQHYKPYFDRNICEAFAKAESLLIERKDYAKMIYYQRIALYASALITIVGILLSNKIAKYLGLTAAAATFIFMLTHYGSSTFKQANLAAELQSAREFLEKLGSTNRIFINPFELMPENLKKI